MLIYGLSKYPNFAFMYILIKIQKKFHPALLIDPARLLKVSKSQKQILKFSFEPKTNEDIFCISALAI